MGWAWLGSGCYIRPGLCNFFTATRHYFLFSFVSFKSQDWRELNRASVLKAIAWAQSNPVMVIIIMQITWRPLLKLMQSMIWLGSEPWERAESLKESNGEQRSFRVLELYLGNSVKEFLKSMNAIFHSSTAALPPKAHLCHLRTLMFRKLGRSVAVVHQVFSHKHRGAPYCLFGALWGLTHDVTNLPECLRDEMTSDFLKLFPGVLDLLVNCSSVSLFVQPRLFIFKYLFILALGLRLHRRQTCLLVQWPMFCPRNQTLIM